MPTNYTITCDIDDVLNYYPQTFINYAFYEHGINISDLSQFKKDNLSRYPEIKSAYRYCS